MLATEQCQRRILRLLRKVVYLQQPEGPQGTFLVEICFADHCGSSGLCTLAHCGVALFGRCAALSLGCELFPQLII